MDGLSLVDGDGLRWWQLTFGGTECEYCGYNIDQIEVTELDGLFSYRLSLGCSGGDGFESRDAVEFVAKLREPRSWIETLDDGHFDADDDEDDNDDYSYDDGYDDEPVEPGLSEFDAIVADVERIYGGAAA
jgi:hypothetical protein